MDPSPALVTQMMELGISEDSARRALKRNGNDIERAAADVFASGGNDEVSNTFFRMKGERITVMACTEMDEAKSPGSPGKATPPRLRDDTPPRILVGKSPIPSPALRASTRLEQIQEHAHGERPPVLELGRAAAADSGGGSIASLDSGSSLPSEEQRELGTDGDPIGGDGMPGNPGTAEQVLEGGRKGRRRVSVSVGLEKIRSMMGKGKDKSVETQTCGSRRGSVGSVGFPETTVAMRRDETVTQLTKSEPLASPRLSAILPRPPRDHARTPTPPYISINPTAAAAAAGDVDLDPSTTPTPDGYLISSVSEIRLVPAPSLASDPPTEWDNSLDLTPTTSRITPCTPTPRNQLHMTNIPTNPGSPFPLPTVSAQQSRRTSLTSPAALKTRSFDLEAQNLMLNALQRGSGGHEHRHLSLSRSSTKDSESKGAGKPGVGGALAALGFKTAAAVGATESVKKSNINVLHPSEPVGAQAPGLNVTAPTPMGEQGESVAAAGGSGYFGSKKSKGRSSRAPRSTNKEDKYRRSLSPFFKGRRSLSRGNASDKRDPSPPVGALSDAGESDGESIVSTSSNRYRPQATAFSLSRRREKNDSDDEDDADQGSDEGDFETDTEYDDDALSHEVVGPDGWVEDVFDPQTEENTKANAVYYEGDAAGLGGEGVLEDEEGHEIEVEVDALGEGPNVVIPPEPLFAQPTMRRPATPPPTDGHVGLAGIVHKEKKKPRPLPLTTSRPEFGRNRCTVKLTQGDPDAALEQSGNRLRSYVVLSDLSAEAGYAIEWCIGTVARDGDEIFLVSVMENEAMVDPKDNASVDKAQKLRIQRERQATAAALARQVTSLLQRTVLNVSVTCQAIHSKNARHMLLDLIDYLEPTMVIVGSRGLGKLQGILLGSTSHYLVQKSSVPVMVARRRLKRPLRKTDPATLRHAPRTSLASASIEKQASTKQEDEVIDAEDVDREADRQEIEDRREREERGRSMGGQGEVVL
ncbi:hypothetical protein NCC49_006107 [Naganishia albida]|nr:hypothetical protein NCC49_006107 [Naganishia albida]